MTRYVENELARGVLPNGRRLVSEKNLLQRRERTVAIGETGWYGMGLMSDAAYGVTVSITAATCPAITATGSRFPDAQVGAVILTNADQGVGMRDPFMRRILEVLYDGKPEAAEDVATSAKLLFESVAVRRAQITVPAAPMRRRNSPRRTPIRTSDRSTVVRDAGGLTFRVPRVLQPHRNAKERGWVDVVYHDRSRQSGVRLRARSGGRTLTLRDGQHTYVFTPS